MVPSCPLWIARFGPANKRLLGAGLRCSLTHYKMKQFIKHWSLQAFDKVKCTKISLLRLVLKITSGHIHRRVEGDTSVV